jgi:hypothetical protein
MKIVLTEWFHAWRGKGAQVICPQVLDLANHAQITYLLAMLGNGEFDEACIESDTPETLEYVRGLLLGTAKAKPLASGLFAAGRLARSGYEVFAQGDAGTFFVNPVPRPELFQGGGLASYSAEFSEAEIGRRGSSAAS